MHVSYLDIFHAMPFILKWLQITNEQWKKEILPKSRPTGRRGQWPGASWFYVPAYFSHLSVALLRVLVNFIWLKPLFLEIKYCFFFYFLVVCSWTPPLSITSQQKRQLSVPTHTKNKYNTKNIWWGCTWIKLILLDYTTHFLMTRGQWPLIFGEFRVSCPCFALLAVSIMIGVFIPRNLHLL